MIFDVGRASIALLPFIIRRRSRHFRAGGSWQAGYAALKPGIHPKYELTTITCGCGAVYEVGSTKKNLRVEICSRCHPFFTGAGQRIVDTGGRVERFKRRFERKRPAAGQ